jgi:hypothetical protein
MRRAAQRKFWSFDPETHAATGAMAGGPVGGTVGMTYGVYCNFDARAIWLENVCKCTASGTAFGVGGLWVGAGAGALLGVIWPAPLITAGFALVAVTGATLAKPKE